MPEQILFHTALFLSKTDLETEKNLLINTCTINSQWFTSSMPTTLYLSGTVYQHFILLTLEAKHKQWRRLTDEFSIHSRKHRTNDHYKIFLQLCCRLSCDLQIETLGTKDPFICVCVSVVTILSLKDPQSLSTTDLLMNKSFNQTLPSCYPGWLPCFPLLHPPPSFNFIFQASPFFTVTPLVIAHLLCPSL